MTHKRFIRIYTRPTRTQDMEISLVAPALRMSPTPLSTVIYVGTGGKWEAWYVEKEFLRLMNAWASLVDRPDWSIDRHRSAFEEDWAVIERAVLELRSAAEDGWGNNLLPLYEVFTRVWDRYVPYIWFPWSITYVLEDRLRDLLQKWYADWQAIYDTLALPSESIQMHQLIEGLLEWKITGGDRERLQQLQQQFGHLNGYSVNDRYWTEKELEGLIAEYADPRDALREMRDGREQTRQKIEHIFSRLRHDDPVLYELARTIHMYVFLRTERIDRYKWGLMNAAPFYRAFERYFQLPSGSAGHLTKKEIIYACETGRVLEEEILHHRLKEMYITHFQKKNTTVIAEPNARDQFLAELIPDYFEKDGKETVRGRSAFPGNARGRVRIIQHAKDIRLLRDGEILVASMTHPEYMVGIRKAGAIVTDEGGVVCHAAIVSRELQIPCVIGTKNATKIFHDGDMVEVDAEKGTIKKI
ncbi:MAG TPA: hypothetical protein DCY48_04335 [Candidatus Magasanikbacteria bacterium]|nr:MAG: hypothetical protein A3I74_00110 [Candidatus Magasanikbacteria bacterium RIFCSPLOWO2_02_FULL_47_16]OGH80140.1 MAG: hypothetical protein A3C10_03120 [Candidatus Magasanikbacteria bacterium RIFCSPHIGHO2_02_FULL_48_18]OGH82652.1 MAG: hypothetical protein A3G08_02840 [Candidatus Magasanikbacteria bacterium RIFCSPLOWO2_12_FULL_47_9b]HAZ28971.1 hypothetical protein [Candidatus Magasanikbacteria bacterium]